MPAAKLTEHQKTQTKLSNKISIHILIDRQVDNTPPTDLKGRVLERSRLGGKCCSLTGCLCAYISCMGCVHILWLKRNVQGGMKLRSESSAPVFLEQPRRHPPWKHKATLTVTPKMPLLPAHLCATSCVHQDLSLLNPTQVFWEFFKETLMARPWSKLKEHIVPVATSPQGGRQRIPRSSPLARTVQCAICNVFYTT